jgi:UDP-N-acetyl-2-amino-2-deoxyglucuronate dehydrogenase
MPTSLTPLGFGLIGAGMIADFHAQAIARIEGARLVGVASRNEASAQALAQKHGAPFATGRIEDLLARPDLDVVCITTPSGAHLEPALAAIAAGKHVVIEKPIEITTERADRILAAAEEAGVLVAPIFQSRFGQGARAVKAAMDAGRLGRLVLASCFVKWHRPDSYYTGWKGTLTLDGGGVVINQGIHGLDLLQWFAGLPDEVFAYATRRVHTGIEAEDTASATMRFPNGALGTIEATTAAWPGWSRRIELCGERGSILLEDDRVARWDFADPLPEDEAIRSARPDEALRSGAGAANAISFEGHLRQIQDLVHALRDGRPLAVDGREARRAVSLVNALYASVTEGRPMRLK